MVGRNKRSALRRIPTDRQRRYWEHLIRDDADMQAHMDYVHFNPVKHGLVRCVAGWPHLTFHRLVKAGVYPLDWAGGRADALGYDDDMRRNALRLLRPTMLILDAR